MNIDQSKIDEILKMDEAKAKRELKKYARKHNVVLDTKKTLSEMEADLRSNTAKQDESIPLEKLTVTRDAVYVRHQDTAFITEGHDIVSSMLYIAAESNEGEFVDRLVKADLSNAAALIQKYRQVGFRDAHTSIYYLVDKETCKTKMPAIKQAF